MLPAYNADYILVYLSSVYGMLAAILICCILAVLILTVFHTAMRQKNQLGYDDGMWMWHDISCKLFDKCIGKCRSISTGSDIYAIFICRRKLYYCFLWTNGYCAEHITDYKNVYPQHVRIRQNKNRIISRVSL